MTEKERGIFYRLLFDLFADNPKRKQPQATEERETNENILPAPSRRTRKLDSRKATTDK